MKREDFLPYLTGLAGVDLDLFWRMLGNAAAHDAYDHLPKVDVPTLVVAGEKDTFTPMWLSVRMHAAIPGSEFLVLPGGSHAAPLEQPEMLASRLRRFLRSALGPAKVVDPASEEREAIAPAEPRTEGMPWGW